MDLKQLEYFKAVADEGTISAAARRLNMSQPPLSNQIHLLEREFGTLLFERGARKIELTEAGRLLYKRAETMLGLARLTEQELADYREGRAGNLRLGVVSSVGTLLLRDWILPFHQKFPQIGFEIYEGNTYQLIEQLRANLIELALVRTPFPTEGLGTRQIRKETMIAAGRPEFFGRKHGPSGTAGEALCAAAAQEAQTAGRTLELSELVGKPLIIYRRWEAFLTERFREAGVVPWYFCINDDARTTLEWAGSGLGIAVCPASAADVPPGQPGLLPYRISHARMESDICAGYAKNGHLSAAARALLAAV